MNYGVFKLPEALWEGEDKQVLSVYMATIYL